MSRAALLVVVIAACGVRAPAPIDTAALVRAVGLADARRDLLARALAHPRDVAPRLALAELDEKDRPGAALAQLEVVETLGGPLGTRWHASDRARLARLLLARGEARVDRASPSALGDLERAKKLGAAVDAHLFDAARTALAIAKLRHVDPGERAKGRALVAATWPTETPAQRGAFGAWVWDFGAKREAYEQLAAWHAAGGDDAQLAGIYEQARAWWIPPEAPGAAPAPAPDREDTREVLHVTGDARALAIAGYARMNDDGVAIVDAFARDPEIAERLAREYLDRSIDAAFAHAQLGALFDALADPARARAHWQAAVDASDEQLFVRGLAEACARGGDADAALVFATGAAAASGDPAVVWERVARLLARVGKHVEALAAARSAIELADRDVLPRALDVAIAASAALGRETQVAELRARRDRFPPPSADIAAALASRDVERLFVISRAHPNDVALRAALVAAAPAGDLRREIAIDELVAFAERGDLDAVAALAR